MRVRIRVFVACFGVGSGALAGPLAPPGGAISSTGKTTQEIFDKAAAAERRVEINATNTPGDADSTFRISQPGSYYLGANMAGEATKKGIEILTGLGAQVTIDLNGFTMTGTGATSTQAAIYIDGASANVRIVNGAIRSWRQAVQHFIGGQVSLEDVHAYGSTITQFDLRVARVVNCTADDGNSSGFVVDQGVVQGCIARSNNGAGFFANSAGVVFRDCRAVGNGGVGFFLGQGAAENCQAESSGSFGFQAPGVLTNCSALASGADGINGSFSAVIRSCHVEGSTANGIRVASNARVEGCTISGSGQHGVRVTGSRCTIASNTIATAGTSAGVFAGVLVAGNDNSIDSNHITNLLAGGDDFGIQVTGLSNLIVRNQMSAVSTYVSIVAGNTSGGVSAAPATATAWSNIGF